MPRVVLATCGTFGLAYPAYPGLLLSSDTHWAFSNEAGGVKQIQLEAWLARHALVDCPLASLAIVDAPVALPAGSIINEVVLGALLPAGPTVQVVPRLACGARVHVRVARLARGLTLLADLVRVVTEVARVASRDASVVKQEGRLVNLLRA